MTIKEYRFFPPVRPLPDGMHPSAYIEKHLKDAAVRNLPVGRQDLTPPFWSAPTHRFRIIVRSIGTALLHLEPTEAESAILNIIGDRFSDMKEVHQELNHAGESIILGGFHDFPSGIRRLAVFLMLEYVPDEAGKEKKRRRR